MYALLELFRGDIRGFHLRGFYLLTCQGLLLILLAAFQTTGVQRGSYAMRIYQILPMIFIVLHSSQHTDGRANHDPGYRSLRIALMHDELS
jgi:hypothetical protein